MDSRELARLLVQAVVRAGAVAGVVGVVGLVAGVGTGLVGLVLVLAGGLVAGMALVNPPSTEASSIVDVDPTLSSVAPMASWEPAGSPPVRRFLFGVVMLVVGVVTVVVFG